MGFLLPTTKISTSQGKQNEFGITSSEYEAEIPFGFGADRLGGNIIWATNLVEEKTVATTKQGGKGSPKTKTTTTTYLYYVDIAVLICEGEIEGITRIWGDGKVIYDAEAGTAIDGLVFRTYLGTEDQLPDALIELDVGANLTPAYRGLAYVVFERLPLSNFGNRIPSFTFEVAFNGSLGASLTTTSDLDGFPNTIYDGGTPYTSFPLNSGGIFNNDLGELVIQADPGTSDGCDVRINMAAQTFQAIPAREEAVFDGENNAMGVHEPTGNYVTHAKPNVGTTRDDQWLRNGTTADIIQFQEDLVRITEGCCVDVSGQAIMVGIQYQNGDLGIDGYSATNLVSGTEIGSLAWPSGYYTAVPKIGRTTAQLAGSGVFAEAFGLWTKTTELKIVQMVATSAGSMVMSVIETIIPSDVVPGATSWNFNPVYVVNRLTGVIYFQHTIDGQPYVWAWSPNTSSILWATPVARVLTGTVGVTGPDGTTLIGTARFGTAGASNIIGGNWVFVDNDKKPIRISLASGVVDPVYDGSLVVDELGEQDPNNSTAAARTTWHWDDVTSTLVGVADSSFGAIDEGIYFHKFNFSIGADLNPQTVISTVCLRAGLTAADIDVSEVPTSQAGLLSMVVRDRTTAADAIAPLLDLLEMEVVETDFQLKFFPRGSGSSVATLSEADMVPTQENTGEPYVRAFLREEDIPRRFEVYYTDFNTDYQPNVGADERSEVTQFSQSVEGFEYNGTCTADLPRRSAQVKLYSAWAERERLRQRLPQKYLYLDPGDVITTQLDNGDEITGRLRKADMGANFNVDVEQVAETTGVYTSTISGAIGDGHFVSTIPNTGDSLTVLLDSPLIRDEDSAGQTQSVTYWASNGADTWPGVILFKETGTSTVQEVGQQIIGIPYGVLASVPADMDREYNRFTDDSFNVTLAQGVDEFESVTDADVLAGRNLLAIVHSDGSLELLQFANVAVVSESTLTLSRCLRGRRGTDSMANGHTIGDTVYLLDAAWADAFSQAVANLNSAQTYRGVTIGQLYEDANPQSYTSVGRDLMPYSPVHFAAVSDGAGGLNLTFTRRTRIGGEDDWLLAGDVPLSEASESYEIDILDGPGGSVLRTLTGTTETINYSSANITSDFGSLPATLDIKGYQISAVVGRGFPAIVTLET